MVRYVLPSALALLMLTPSCVIGSDDGFEPTPDGNDPGTDGDGNADAIGITPLATDPSNLNIGFNGADASEFGYYPDYFQTANAITFGPNLCHTYVQWNVADQAPHAGTVDDHHSRAYLDDWLSKAQGHCGEALISFKTIGVHGAAPGADTYQQAFDKFAATDWAAETGFTGKLSVTPWNEPNNKADAGNGLGVVIEARLAARYYLAAEAACRKHGCTVAAGDFASNGDMWDSFEWNCANDNVNPGELCKSKSAANPGNAAASYLDLYKNEIVNSATSYGLPKGFRPEFFAYHGWHDANEYLDNAQHCDSYDNCALRRILRSLGGSWANVEIWDSEDGAGQTQTPNDHDQACTAAFMLRLQAITSRVRRMYITRLNGGGGQLITTGHVARPALGIFAQRKQSYDGTCK
jgi:hypothetical protein